MPRPHHKSRATTKTSGIGKWPSAAQERRARALAASIAATQARKRMEHRIDWDAVIERFKADMAKRWAEEGDAV